MILWVNKVEDDVENATVMSSEQGRGPLRIQTVLRMQFIFTWLLIAQRQTFAFVSNILGVINICQDANLNSFFVSMHHRSPHCFDKSYKDCSQAPNLLKKSVVLVQCF